MRVANAQPLASFFSAVLLVLGCNAAQMVSVDYTGLHPGSSGVDERFAASADGRFAVFASFGTNYVRVDTNGLSDLFVYDSLLRSNIWDTTFSHVAPSGNVGSYPVEMTPDGRFLLFFSRATNFVSNVSLPPTAGYQLYLQDLVSNITTLVSISYDGTTAANSPVYSDPVSGASLLFSLSSDGRFAAFISASTNLVTTVDTNNANDVFCRDTLLGSTELITVSPSGTALDRAAFNFVMSTNGRYFAFDTAASNAVSGITNSAGFSQVYWRDRQFGTNAPVALTVDGKFDDGGSSLRAMSADGRFVCFSAGGTNFVLNQNDQNHTLDLFIRDMQAGETWLVTRATNGATSAGRSTGGQFSANGEWLIFSAASADLVPGVQDANGGNVDLFAHHLPTRTNLIVSASHDGLSGADAFTSSDFARISSSGRFVLFSTSATNLIVGLTNHIQRLFIRDLRAGRTLDPLRVPVAPMPSFNVARFTITDSQRFIFFLTFANLDPFVPNTNQQLQLFRAPLFAPEVHAATEPGHLRALGLAGASYISEATSNLVNWTAIATNLADANGELTIVDPEAGNHSRRFYRLLSP